MEIPACLTDANRVSLKLGERIFSSGDRCEAFYYLLSGSVRVDLISRTGKSILLYHFGGGESCILTSSCLISGDDYGAEANVEEDCQALWISASEFTEQLNKSDEFRKLVFASFSTRFSEMITKMGEVAFSPFDARLAHRLCALRSENGFLEITHEQLANDLGSAREVISRRLALWEGEGLISRRRGGIEILAASHLRKMMKLGD